MFAHGKLARDSVRGRPLAKFLDTHQFLPKRILLKDIIKIAKSIISSDEGECLLACKSTTPDGHVTVRGPLQALPGTRCTTVTGDSGVCVNSLCAVSRGIT